MSESSISCLNCNAPLKRSDIYCSSCGQRKKIEFSFGSVLSEAFQNFFNLDSRIFRTLKDLWIPGRLTRAYIGGKRKNYINPARLFLMTLLLFFASIGIWFNNLDQDFGSKDVIAYNEKEVLKTKYDSLLLVHPLMDSTLIDTFRNELFGLSDSSDIYFVPDMGSITVFGTDFTKYKILKTDVANLSISEIIEKHKITGFKEKHFVRQAIKHYKDRKGMIRQMIGSLVWCIFMTILAVALTMKLLYIRGKYYYIEHLILLFHHHSQFFIMYGVFIILYLLGLGQLDSYNNWASFLFIVSLFVYLKMYYQQNIFKTFLKWFVLLISYVFGMAGFALLVITVSLLLF